MNKPIISHFDFDTPIDRHDTLAVKWESVPSGVIPLTVADMDFAVAPVIRRALQERLDHPVYGYTHVPKAYYQAVTDWFSTHHHWEINPDSIIYTSGVVPAISAILQALTQPGDEVIVQGPVYNCFYSSIRNSGCTMVSNSLVRDTQGRYHIDFEDLERKASGSRARILLFCNPHNPAGRAWTREEMSRVADICLKNDLVIISDEIHCELTMPGHEYIPFATLGERVRGSLVSCVSPSKAFNIAGLQIANIIADDPQLYRKIDRAININEVCDVNPFGVTALIAAYGQGKPWLDDLKAYLADNYIYAKNRIAEAFPQIVITPLEATYLLWFDITPLGLDSRSVAKTLVREFGVALNEGSIYGEEGRGFLRLNLAYPRAVLAEGLERLITGLKRMTQNP